MSDLSALQKLVQEQGETLKAQGRLLEEQGHRLAVQEDVEAVRNLHFTYGYYLDKCHYEEVVDLFEETGSVVFFGMTYTSKPAIRRLYLSRFQQNFVLGRNGPVKGFLLDHLLAQEVIHVSPDRLEAKVRARTLMSAGRHKDHQLEGSREKGEPRQWWEGGIHENTYGRASTDEPWKIRVLNYYPVWHADYSTGWAHTPANYVPKPTTTFPTDPTGATSLDPDAGFLWPDTHTVPFHYDHPVTGGQLKVGDMKAPELEQARKEGEQRKAQRAQVNGNGVAHRVG